MVPFPVGCPRCGHGLNGSNDAACTACGLELHWPDVVPIEKLRCQACRYPLYGLTTERCPECGEPFTWEAALERYHRTNKNLFEYRWREAPLRSLWSSCKLSLNTRKTWEVIQITDPPPVGPLLVLLSFAVGLGIAGPLLVQGAAKLMMWALEGTSVANGYYELRWFFGVGAIRWSFALALTFMLLGWVCGGLGSLLLLRWSMEACRVRNGHVIRAYVYSVLPAFLVPTMTMLVNLAWAIDSVYRSGRYWRSPVLLLALPAIVLLLVVMRIKRSYQGYVRMPHSVWVAILTQVIAACCLLIATIWATLLRAW